MHEGRLFVPSGRHVKNGIAAALIWFFVSSLFTKIIICCHKRPAPPFLKLICVKHPGFCLSPLPSVFLSLQRLPPPYQNHTLTLIHAPLLLLSQYTNRALFWALTAQQAHLNLSVITVNFFFHCSHFQHRANSCGLTAVV